MSVRTEGYVRTSPRIDLDPLGAGTAARTRGDPATALRLWDKHRERYPTDPVVYALSGSLLRELKRLDMADSVLKEGLRRCPDDLSMAIEYAWVAQDRSDWPEALGRWRCVMVMFPLHPVACGGAAQALIELERFSEADAQLAPMRTCFPDDYYFAVSSAVVATKLQNWREALTRWDLVHAIKPDCAVASSHRELIRKLVGSELIRERVDPKAELLRVIATNSAPAVS